MESNLFRAEFYKVIILFPIAIINKIEKLLNIINLIIKIYFFNVYGIIRSSIRQIFNNYNCF